MQTKSTIFRKDRVARNVAIIYKLNISTKSSKRSIAILIYGCKNIDIATQICGGATMLDKSLKRAKRH
jgi:hypothetical protein